MLKQITSFAIFSLVLAYVSSTPLDDYVNAPDDHYGYQLIKTYNMTGYTLYILNLTSQKWLDGRINY
jgi:hypothetical protein